MTLLILMSAINNSVNIIFCTTGALTWLHSSDWRYAKTGTNIEIYEADLKIRKSPWHCKNEKMLVCGLAHEEHGDQVPEDHDDDP